MNRLVFILSIFCLLLSYSSTVLSETNSRTSLQFTFASEHTAGGNFNETNPGLGFEHSIIDNQYYATSGFFKNSFSDTAVYGGIGRQWRSKYVSAGVEAVAMAGYDTPLVGILPYVSFGPEKANLKTYAMPGEGGFIFGFQFRYRLGQ